MTDLREQLRDVFRGIVEEQFNKKPDDLQIIRTPIGKFADAAADLVGAMPSPPRYYPDDVQPSYANTLTREDIENGAEFSTVSAHYDKETGGVVLLFANGETGTMTRIGLRPEIAEQYFHQGLAVVRHARDQA